MFEVDREIRGRRNTLWATSTGNWRSAGRGSRVVWALCHKQLVSSCELPVRRLLFTAKTSAASDYCARSSNAGLNKREWHATEKQTAAGYSTVSGLLSGGWRVCHHGGPEPISRRGETETAPGRTHHRHPRHTRHARHLLYRGLGAAVQLEANDAVAGVVAGAADAQLCGTDKAPTKVPRPMPAVTVPARPSRPV